MGPAISVTASTTESMMQIKVWKRVYVSVNERMFTDSEFLT